MNRITASGSNQSRVEALHADARRENFRIGGEFLRLEEETFRVWADAAPPPDGYHVWCRDSREAFVDDEYAAAKRERGALHLSALVVHGLTTSPGLRPCHVAFEADGILRSFPTEQDLRRYLLHLGERICAGTAEPAEMSEP